MRLVADLPEHTIGDAAAYKIHYFHHIKFKLLYARILHICFYERTTGATNIYFLLFSFLFLHSYVHLLQHYIYLSSLSSQTLLHSLHIFQLLESMLSYTYYMSLLQKCDIQQVYFVMGLVATDWRPYLT